MQRRQFFKKLVTGAASIALAGRLLVEKPNFVLGNFESYEAWLTTIVSQVFADISLRDLCCAQPLCEPSSKIWYQDFTHKTAQTEDHVCTRKLT